MEADKYLRKHTSRKGDVSFQVNQALLGADLENLEVKPRSKTPGNGGARFEATSVKFKASVYERVVKIARARGVSAMALIDAAMISFFKSRAINVKK